VLIDSQDTPKAPVTTGAFYFFNHARHTQKRIQYLAPYLLNQLVCPPSITLQSTTKYPKAQQSQASS
jgi:hypothetical protein